MARKWLLSTSTFILTAGLLLLYSSHQAVLKSRVWPLGVAVGEPLHYLDSTTDAHSWHWEFGQGETSLAPRGEFYYRRPGTYKVRLTVDGHHESLFTVSVKAPLHRDSTIRLLGPTEGSVDEKLTFQTFGAPAHKYTWYFGQSGQIDSHEAVVFYAYTKPGTYLVRLATDVTPRLLQQKITIRPRYSPFVQPADTAADDIRLHLQRIADGQQVNQQYTYLLNRYLCGQADAPVLAGALPPSDFYSYCMNLQFDPNWVIDAAKVEVDTLRGLGTACTARLIVTQHKNE